MSIQEFEFLELSFQVPQDIDFFPTEDEMISKGTETQNCLMKSSSEVYQPGDDQELSYAFSLEDMSPPAQEEEIDEEIQAETKQTWQEQMIPEDNTNSGPQVFPSCI